MPLLTGLCPSNDSISSLSAAAGSASADCVVSVGAFFLVNTPNRKVQLQIKTAPQMDKVFGTCRHADTAIKTCASNQGQARTVVQASMPGLAVQVTVPT